MFSNVTLGSVFPAEFVVGISELISITLYELKHLCQALRATRFVEYFELAFPVPGWIKPIGA